MDNHTTVCMQCPVFRIIFDLFMDRIAPEEGIGVQGCKHQPRFEWRRQAIYAWVERRRQGVEHGFSKHSCCLTCLLYVLCPPFLLDWIMAVDFVSRHIFGSTILLSLAIVAQTGYCWFLFFAHPRPIIFDSTSGLFFLSFLPFPTLTFFWR